MWEDVFDVVREGFFVMLLLFELKGVSRDDVIDVVVDVLDVFDFSKIVFEVFII